jgi:hypothetical protein
VQIVVGIRIHHANAMGRSRGDWGRGTCVAKVS